MSLALLFLYLMLKMFRMLIHPYSGACDLFVELFHGLYCSVKIEIFALACLFSGECLVVTFVVVLESVFLQILAASLSYGYWIFFVCSTKPTLLRPMNNTMTLLKPLNNPSLLLPYEKYYTQSLHHEGNLIPEQSPGDINPLFQTFINPQSPHSTWTDQLCFSLQTRIPHHHSQTTT